MAFDSLALGISTNENSAETGMERWSNIIVRALSVVLASVICGTAVAETADEILDVAGVKGGLVVHLGCADGDLPETQVVRGPNATRSGGRLRNQT